VFAVVGERHVIGLSTALQYLKRFSHADIIVFQSRSRVRCAHDQVVEVTLSNQLDDHQASIALKTNLLAHVGNFADRYCYLDGDVIAVRDDVDAIFDLQDGAVRFARDHVDLDTFSRWAVHCRCRESRCNHLREAILCSFGVELRWTDWTLWNGGVFLFDDRSWEFMRVWHAMVLEILDDPYWTTRDQGALAAAAWKLGLEDLEPLPAQFNFIVDRMWGIPVARRAAARVEDFHIREDYSLSDEAGRIHPRLIHFINGGVGQVGWRHWDEVSKLVLPTGEPGVVQ